MWLKAQIEQLRVDGVVVVLLLFHTWWVKVGDLSCPFEGFGNHVGHVKDRERLSELVEHAELALFGRVQTCQLNTGQGVSDVEHSSGLPAFSKHCDWVANDRLGAESVDDRSKNTVIVKTRRQVRMLRRLRCLLPVDNTLVQIG